MNISSRTGWASAFFLAIALFYAPLAYGCTRPDMLPMLFDLLIAAIVTGAIHFLANFPRRTLLLLFCVSAILIQGWWKTWNPVLPRIASYGGTTADISSDYLHHISFDSMLMTTLLLGAFVVVYDLFGHPDLRRMILLAAAISGVLISVIGIVFKLGGSAIMRFFWRPAEMDWNTFAFYRYHGNAGAFLNLTLPLILVFTRRAYAPTASVGQKILWTLASVACVGALFLNASKAALLIGLLILPWPFFTSLARMPWKILFLLAVASLFIIITATFVSAQLSRQAAFQRMTNSSEVASSFAGRLSDYQDDISALPEAGWFGFGPGLFKVAFPYQMSLIRNAGNALHDYAHEDYLQTALEWGWLGTVWWTFLVVGGLVRAIGTYLQRERFGNRTDRHLLLAAILGVCGTLVHALIDFPLQIASIRLFFLILLALCWASPRLLTASYTEAPR